MNIEDIDIEKLRQDLIDYFGSAMFSGFNMAIIDLTEVENASPEELLIIARKNKVDLSKYYNRANNTFRL